MEKKYKAIKSDNGRRYKIYRIDEVAEDLFEVSLTGLTRGVKNTKIYLNKESLEACEMK